MRLDTVLGITTPLPRCCRSSSDQPFSTIRDIPHRRTRACLRTVGEPQYVALRNTMRVLLAIVVALLVAIGAAASVAYFRHDFFNPRYGEFPRVVGVHVVLGGLYLVLAPLQFLTGSRGRALAYHRWAGRALATSGVIVGATVTFILVFIPGGGWREQVAVGPFAVFFLVALGTAVYYIRSGSVALHREWMIRAFAVGLGIATQRVLFVALKLAFVGHRRPELEEIVFFMTLSFLMAFVLHLAVAEVWIRSGRRQASRILRSTALSASYVRLRRGTSGLERAARGGGARV